MRRHKKPDKYLIERALDTAKRGAIALPVLINRHIDKLLDAEKPYYELLLYLKQFDYYVEDSPMPPAFSRIAKELKMSNTK